MTKKILIACYSYSGNTLHTAAAIRQTVGGELCCIYPWQPYPPGYQELVRQARREVHDGYRPRLLPLSARPDGYDIIFAGTPNWCGTMAPPLASFLASFDWGGKTVIPFCTHGGGGMGRVAKEIACLCPGAEIRPGFHVMGDGGSRLEMKVRRWIEGLELGLECV